MREVVRFCLVCVVFVGLMMPTASGAAAAPAVVAGTGHSALKDAGKAGVEAATKAKAALGGQAAKVVIVFDSLPGKVPVKEKLLAGVGKVFDASIIYGCSGYDPITQESNFGTVGVLAIAGKIEATGKASNLEGGHEACGRRIGEALKPSVPEKGGRVVLLFGSCHVPADDKLVKGVCSVLGEKFPAAGAAASKGEFAYCKGKVLRKSNIGLLLTGAFKCGFATKDGKGVEGVISSARDAVAQAAGADKSKAALVFAFDCGGRRGTLKQDRVKELDAMREAIGKVPIFGFYGSGEIGPKDNNSPARGVGYHIAACVIIPD